MSGGPQVDKLIFLLEDPQRISLLREWCPKDSRACGSHSRVIKDLTAEQYLVAARQVLDDRAIKVVRQCVARQVLMEGKQMNCLLKGGHAQGLTSFVGSVLLHIATAKLGSQPYAPKEIGSVPEIPADIYRSLVKCRASLNKKLRNASGVALSTVATEWKSLKERMEMVEAEERAKVAALNDQAGEARPQKSNPEKVADDAPEPELDPLIHDSVKVRMVVHTISRKDKDDLDNNRATWVVGGSECWAGPQASLPTDQTSPSSSNSPSCAGSRR